MAWSRAAASPVPQIVCSAAATSAPSWLITGVRVPTWLARAGAAASVLMWS